MSPISNKDLGTKTKEIFGKSEISQFISNLNLKLPNNNPKDLPIHLKEIMPSATKEFIQWLVGFTDAEGFFYIYNNNSWTAASLRFSIELHADDIRVLHKIAQTLGVGRVVKDKKRNSAVFYVVNFNDINRVIIPLFKEFPLQTTKYLDFTFFSKAALIKSKSPEGVSKLSKTDLIGIKT